MAENINPATYPNTWAELDSVSKFVKYTKKCEMTFT